MITTRLLVYTFGAFLLVSLSSCEVGRKTRSQHYPIPQGATVSPYQDVCDVERLLLRAGMLERYQIETFRKIALKISQELTPDSIESLRRLEPGVHRTDEHDWEVKMRRGELIQEIYGAAIARAGLKKGVIEKIPESQMSFVADVLAIADSPFIGVLSGRLSGEPEKLDVISHVSLAPNSQQSRYFVMLLKPYRFEIRADGSASPVFESLSLMKAVDEQLPEHCRSAGTAFKYNEFNTVEGLAPSPH